MKIRLRSKQKSNGAPTSHLPINQMLNSGNAGKGYLEALKAIKFKKLNGQSVEMNSDPKKNRYLIDSPDSKKQD